MIPGINPPGRMTGRAGTVVNTPTDITLTSQTVAETSADTVAANTVIGTLGASGGTAPYTFSIVSGNANVSGTSLRAGATNGWTNGGSPYNVTVRVTDSASQTYDKVFAITVTDYVADQVIAEIVVHNHGGTDSPEIISFTHPFADGDVPSGNTVYLRRKTGAVAIPTVLDGVNTWNDGSLRLATLHGVGTSDITASTSRTYEIVSTSGSRTPSASGFDLWGHLDTLTDANDLHFELTNMKNNAGSAMSPASRPISLNAHLQTSTRRFRLCDAAQVQVWKAWGMAAATGLPGNVDGHIKCHHWGVTYRDGSGNVLGTWYLPQIKPDWWEADPLASGENKDNRLTDVILKYGSTTLQQYFGDNSSTQVRMLYHASLLGVQRTGDSRGEGWWIAGTESRQPTFWYEHDRAYLKTTNMITPVDASIVLGYELADYDYGPYDNYNFQQIIAATGGSDGIGAITNSDVKFLIAPTKDNYRNWLVTAYAGMHCPLNSTSQHLTDSTIGDVAARIIPYQTQDNSSGETTNHTTGQLDGLGARAMYNCLNSGNVTRTYTAATGTTVTGLASWGPEDEFAHAPAWNYLPALLLGGPMARLFREECGQYVLTSMARMIHGCLEQTHHEYQWGGRGSYGWQLRASTPAIRDVQVRSNAWGMNILTNALAVQADGDPVQTHLLEIFNVAANREKLRIDYIKAQGTDTQGDRKILYIHGSYPMLQKWMHDFLVGTWCWAALRFPHISNLRTVANYLSANPVQRLASTTPLKQMLWWEPTLLAAANYNPSTNDFIATNACGVQVQRHASTATIMIKTNQGSNRNEFPLSNGDAVFFTEGGAAPPSGLTVGTTYYIVSIAGDRQSWGVAATPGGSAISMGASSGYCMLWCNEPALLVGETDIFDAGLNMGTNADYFDLAQIGLWSACIADHWIEHPDSAVEADSGDITTARANLAALLTAMESGRDSGAAGNPNFYVTWQATPT